MIDLNLRPRRAQEDDEPLGKVIVYCMPIVAVLMWSFFHAL